MMNDMETKIVKKIYRKYVKIYFYKMLKVLFTDTRNKEEIVLHSL